VHGGARAAGACSGSKVRAEGVTPKWPSDVCRPGRGRGSGSGLFGSDGLRGCNDSLCDGVTVAVIKETATTDAVRDCPLIGATTFVGVAPPARSEAVAGVVFAVKNIVTARAQEAVPGPWSSGMKMALQGSAGAAVAGQRSLFEQSGVGGGCCSRPRL
jgi:hypothetical protein